MTVQLIIALVNDPRPICHNNVQITSNIIIIIVIIVIIIVIIIVCLSYCQFILQR